MPATRTFPALRGSDTCSGCSSRDVMVVCVWAGLEGFQTRRVHRDVGSCRGPRCQSLFCKIKQSGEALTLPTGQQLRSAARTQPRALHRHVCFWARCSSHFLRGLDGLVPPHAAYLCTEHTEVMTAHSLWSGRPGANPDCPFV